MKLSTLITTATAAATVGLLTASLSLVQAQTTGNADKPSYSTAGSNTTTGSTTDNMQGTTGASRPAAAPTTSATTPSSTSSGDMTGSNDSTLAARSDRN